MYFSLSNAICLLNAFELASNEMQMNKKTTILFLVISAIILTTSSIYITSLLYKNEVKVKILYIEKELSHVEEYLNSKIEDLENDAIFFSKNPILQNLENI